MSRRIIPFAPLAIAALAAHSPALGPGQEASSSPSETTEPSALQLACKLPFDSMKERHPIDDSCASSGAASSDSPQALQNTEKNQFCATSDPVVLTFRDFDDLQAAAEAAQVTFGSDAQLPKNRSALASLLSVKGAGSVGEGSVVRLAAYVLDAHYSNVGSGESVNCKTHGPEWNDIHIVLVQQPGAEACESVTAEMSPHFRPEIWNPTTLSNVVHSGRPLRFTGHLFFDGSHRPCVGGKGNPARRSLFEIHPVYSVEVCRQTPAAGADIASACDAANDADWQSLEGFTGSESGSTDTGTS